ncbi:MAG: glycosyltransferase family 2 protein [Planctomycetota bacterium]
MNPQFQNFISVVLPAYNEQDCITKSVSDAVAYLATAFARHEVIVVDDGSRDRTAALVTELAREHASVRLISHAANQGYGRAIATGFAAAKGDLVFFTDSDNQFDIREISDLMPLLAQADAVFGFRVYRFDSVLRCILSWIYNRLVRILFRVKVRDVDCSFKLFTRPVVDRLVIESKDFFVDTEMVARTRKLGFRIVEKGVRHYPRTAGHTTVRASDIPRTLKTVARMWLRINFPPRAERPAAAAGSDAPQVR